MSKIVPLKDFGIPVNSAIPTTNHIIAYFGPHPLNLTDEAAVYGLSAPKSGDSSGRIDCGPISSLKTATLNGPSEWDLSDITSQLPTGLSGSYDFVFTDMDANGNESDFSPVITVEVDTTVPLALGQPVQL
jgi:hypothetical protein